MLSQLKYVIGMYRKSVPETLILLLQKKKRNTHFKYHMHNSIGSCKDNIMYVQD